MSCTGTTTGDYAPGLQGIRGNEPLAARSFAGMRSKLFRLQYWAPARVRAVAWRALTVLTCPCCIPVWLWLLSGTALGALVSRNLFVAVALFLLLFFYCLRKALRSYDQVGDTPGAGDRHEAS